MATKTFYARGDSSNANNASLNAQTSGKTPTTTLVFSSGDSGDLVLDYNNGDFDPDTTVLVDGVERFFSVEFSGNLPFTNKLKDVNGEDLRGEEIIVITTDDGQRYFFLADGTMTEETMDAFPNGAHPIDNLDNVNDVPICFVGGTLIKTPDGYVPVETLVAGDVVLNSRGQAVPLRWVSSRKLTFSDLLCDANHRPVCIPQDFLGPGQPYRDLWVSPQHRILVNGWEAELLFRSREVLVAAKHLVGPTPARPADVVDGVEYFHLLFDQHEILVSNGLTTESLHPGDMAISSFSPDARSELLERFPEYGANWRKYGPTVRPTLTRYEAQVLMAYIGVGTPATAAPVSESVRVAA